MSLGSGSPGSGRAAYPESVERLIERFRTLPGIGRRSAERMAFDVMKRSKSDAESLAKAIRDVTTTVRPCRVCFNFAEDDLCPACSDERRDASLVMVVEEPRDVIAIEQVGMYRGVYHVLLGRIAPLDGVGPADLTISFLLDRIRDPSKNARGVRVEEVILALNPTLEGDGTALYLIGELKKLGVRTSRLARGLPSGGHLQMASKAVLADALSDRRPAGGE